MTIERGFWMFDTPCTQALWEAVMGENPSQFRSPTRPVEQVSWDDCQEFVYASERPGGGAGAVAAVGGAVGIRVPGGDHDGPVWRGAVGDRLVQREQRGRDASGG